MQRLPAHRALRNTPRLRVVFDRLVEAWAVLTPTIRK